MRIDSSGNVGIGISSPATKMHVNSGVYDTIATFESGDRYGTLRLKDSTSTASTGGVTFGVDGDELYVQTGSTNSTAMRIDSNKDIFLSGGVYLGGTGSANKLDDYEEGTWTPVITSSNGTTTSSNTCLYVKVGSSLFLSGRAEFSNISTTHGTAHLSISTPFALKSGSNYNSTDVTINFWGANMSTALWNVGMPGFSINQNASTHGLYTHGAFSPGYNSIQGTEVGDGSSQISFNTVVFTN
jgi:hypothetical protein